ncbi:hypothetical protein D3C79_984460 [compost metagenome]
MRLPARFGDSVCGQLRCSCVQICHDHTCASEGKGFGDAAADACTASRYYGNTIIETESIILRH